MGRRRHASLLLVALTGGLLPGADSGQGPPVTPPAQPNDNLRPAGVVQGDTLVVRLVLTHATWYPEGDDGPAILVVAVAEEGRPAMVPAPLLRLREGMVVEATVRNGLADSAVTFAGLHAHPASGPDAVPVTIEPGATHRFRFGAGAPGTYLYGAVTPVTSSSERETAVGALVVDPRDGSPPDRVFVINIWTDSVERRRDRRALAINGRSWPHTERFEFTAGDSVRWRWVNASHRNHPMHLHGFYFRVDSRGSRLADSVYPADRRALAVTEVLPPQGTLRLAWSPDREGNWLFHCHFAVHSAPTARYRSAEAHDPDHGSSDPARHMAGLVLGIRVRPGAVAHPPTSRAASRLRLFVQEGPRRQSPAKSFSYIVQRGPAPPARDSIEVPGSLLLLEQGRPADITVFNRLAEPTAVHWHGIELESRFDGVAGWSGSGADLARMIAPGDSFTARLLLPRAGTFIYHTHLHDIRQLGGGLYGPLIVLPPGVRRDPSRDHLVVIGWDGTEEGARRLVNGDSVAPPPLELAAGVGHRFRLVNIGVAGLERIAITEEGQPASWRPVAKDGADLPPALTAARPAIVVLGTGETADFEFTPRREGRYRIEVRGLAGPPHWSRTILVR